MRGNIEKTLPHAFVKLLIHAFVSLNMVSCLSIDASLRPLQPRLHLDVEDQRQVRGHLAHHRTRKLPHHVGTQFQPAALIGDGGIAETVADHAGPLLQGRKDGARQVVVAGGEKQQGFAHGAPASHLPFHQQPPDILGAWRPAGFAGGQHLQALGAQGLSQKRLLGGLPRSFSAFKGYEDAVSHRVMSSGPFMFHPIRDSKRLLLLF